MAVKITKPEINIREKIAELDKPSGIAGEAMLRAETPQEQQALIGVGRRNKVINGSMLIWQRGTVQTTSNNNSYHCVDRWAPYSSGRTQYQQSTDVPDGFAYALATSGTPTGEYVISHGIELPGAGIAGEFYVGQKFTVSYYAKSTVAGDRLMDWMAFRVGQTSSSSQVEAKVNDGSQYHSLSTGWKRYSRTYTITGTPAANNICVALAIRNHWDNPIAAGNISITGVQLEIGSTVTPFEHRSYGEELALCQRYYQRIDGTHITGNASGDRGIYHAHLWQTNNVYWIHHFVTPMRTGPSFLLSTSAGSLGTWYSGGGTTTPTSFGMQSANTNRVEHSGSLVGNFTAGNSAWFRLAANQWVAYSAEL